MSEEAVDRVAHKWGRQPGTKDLALSAIVSWLLFLASAALMKETRFAYWVQERFENGWGLYQVWGLGALVALVAWIVVDARRWWLQTTPQTPDHGKERSTASLLQRILCESSYTAADHAFVALALWGVCWQLVWGRPCKLVHLGQVDLDWPQLRAIQNVGLGLWVTGLVFAPLRAHLRWLHRETQERPAEGTAYLLDYAQIPGQEDLLQRSPLVDRVTDAIRGFRGQGSMVIALTGEWGVGKTTIANYALGQLKKSGEQILYVKLSPWHFSNTENGGLQRILQEFFHSLNAEVQSRFFRPDIASLIHRYYSSLLPAARTLSPLTGSLGDSVSALLATRSGDLLRTKERLRQKLKGLPVKIVVFIDDIDRLQPKEIPFVLKLLHLCANFDNIIYILAFDRDAINSQIDRKLHGYLDKVVQLEIPIPDSQPYVLAHHLERYLREAAEEQGLDLEDGGKFAERFEELRLPIVQAALTNLRRIKVAVNRFKFLAPLLPPTELNAFDLFCIELVRFRFPHLYSEIRRHRADLIVDGSSPSDNKIANRPARIKGWLQDIVKDPVVDESRLVVLLLKSMFGLHITKPTEIKYATDGISVHTESVGMQECLSRRLIRHSRYFDRYFYYAVAEGVIPNKAWNRYVEAINANTDAHLPVLLAKNLDEYRRTNAGATWLREMSLFAIDRLEPAKARALAMALTDRWSDLRETPDRNGFREYSEAVGALRRIINTYAREWSSIEALDLFAISGAVALLPELLDTFTTSLARPDGGPTPEQLATISGADRICRGRITRSAENDDNLFQEPHLRYSLNSLFRFHATPADTVYALLDQDPRDLTRLLELYVAGSRLEYKLLLERYEPKRLRAIAERLRSVDDLTDVDIWLLDALDKGIDCHTDYGFRADYVSDEHGQFECYRFEPGGRIFTPAEALPELLERFWHDDCFHYKELTMNFDPRKLCDLANQTEKPSDLSENTRGLLTGLRKGWECHSEQGQPPEFVRYDNGKFVCEPESGTESQPTSD